MSVIAPELIQPSVPRMPDRSDRVAVRVSDLSKSFVVRRGWMETMIHPLRIQRAAVLKQVSLDIVEGEFFGLLGPNGAGKTTLFKILSTLILPDEGSAEVAGFDVSQHPVRVRDFLAPVVAEERSLNWRLSAFENLRVFAALQGLSGSELRSRIQEVLDQVELADTGSKMVGTFSSGMKQRLLIARALLARPKVLLLDEPTRALDPVSARKFRRFLREELADRQGCTILLATHNTEEAIELCDRIGILHHGRLVRVGSPGQLMQEYRDEDYRLWIHDEDWTRFLTVATAQFGAEPRFVAKDDPEWTTTTLRIAGGPNKVNEVISKLVLSDIRLARIEPVHISLADLIERILERGQGARPHV